MSYVKINFYLLYIYNCFIYLKLQHIFILVSGLDIVPTYLHYLAFSFKIISYNYYFTNYVIADWR